MAKTPGKRKLHSESKRELIIEKSLELFRRYTYEKTTITDICDECGVNVGTVYHFFGSKWGILEAISSKMFVSGVLTENVSKRVLDPYKALMEFHLDYAKRWTELGVDLTMHFYSNFQKLSDSPAPPNYPSMGAVKELGLFIRKAQEAGTFDADADAMETAGLIILLGRGVVYDWCLHGGTYDLAEKSAEVMGMITKFLIAGISVAA